MDNYDRRSSKSPEPGDVCKIARGLMMHTWKWYSVPQLGVVGTRFRTDVRLFRLPLLRHTCTDEQSRVVGEVPP
eukprot:scaffold38588_cov69-Phaeocystis_antarctica.AAC.3